MGHFYKAEVKKAKAGVRGEVTGGQEGTTDRRKQCSGSWEVRAQVGFVSPGSAGAAGCLSLTSSCDFLVISKINRPWISRDWLIYRIWVTWVRRGESQYKDCQRSPDEKFKLEDELLAVKVELTCLLTSVNEE